MTASATRPSFSVITANFNSGVKLAATVASVREQNVDIEHWIVDGVSTDGSLELARQLAAERPHQTRVVSQRDRGVYDAMNTGIRASTGRYLYFLGAGDVLRPDALRAVRGYLPDDDRALVYGDTMHVPYGIYDGPFDRRKLISINLCHQSAFYGRDVFAMLGEYDLRYRAYADWDFNLRCFGDRRVQKKYVPVLVADFEAGGISGGGDPVFMNNKRRIALKHYGVWGSATLIARELAIRPLRRLGAIGRSLRGN